ncbi:unnamed protein product [Sympodiomycopsis kandeliae]
MNKQSHPVERAAGNESRVQPTQRSIQDDVPPRSSTLRLVLIRHPYTIANAQGLLQGSTDSALTQYGVQQMEKLTSYFASGYESTEPSLLSPLPPLHIISSPLGRCMRVAQSLSESMKGAPAVTQLKDLQEKDFGPLECTKKGVHAGGSFPKPTSGSVKETREIFEARVRRAVTHILKLGETTQDHKPLIVIVTHGLWISTFARLYLNPNGTTFVPFAPFAENTGMFIVDATTHSFQRTSMSLVKANWMPHLQDMAKRQRGLSNIADDGKQRKLSAFFAKPKRQREDEDDSHGRGSDTPKAHKAGTQNND